MIDQQTRDQQIAELTNSLQNIVSEWILHSVQREH